MRWGTTERSRAWCCTRIRPDVVYALTFALAALLAIALRPAPTNGPFARDFEAYYAAGAVWNAGGDPYARDVWNVERTIPGVDASHDEMLPFVGPAAALPFWSLLARLPFASARVLWESLLALAIAGIIAGSLTIARGRITPARAAAAIALAVTSGPIVSGFTLGQAALLGAAATILGFVALERRPAWAIPAAFVAAIQPNLALPLAVRALDRRAFGALACAAAAFLAVTLAVGGGGAGIAAYLRLLRAHDAAERYITIQHTVPAIAASFGASHALADGLGAAASLAALAGVIVAAVRLRAQPAIVACVAVALLPILVPFFHEHDFAIDLLPAIVLFVRGDARIRALAGIATVMTMIDWFGFAQRPHATPQIAALVVCAATACALLATRTDDASCDARLAGLAPLVAAAILAAGVIPLAHAFVAPTWPDTLGPYHAPPGAGISTIWGEEGRRSGLGAIVPAWSVLRAIPLLGCVLLAYASARLALPLQATTIAPSRTASATLASDSPLHGPSVQ
jgi:hypothetical protein